MRKQTDRLVVAWVLAGLTFAVAYPSMSDGTPLAALCYNAFNLGTVAAFVIGIRRSRPADRLGWSLFAAAVTCRVTGDIVYEINRQVLHQPAFPSPADVFYLAAIPLLFAGTLRLTSGQGPADRGGLLDAGVITTGLGLVWWLFVIGPIVNDEALPLRERLISSAYPFTDLLLLFVVARLLTRAGRPGRSLVLLAIGMAGLLLADVGYQLAVATAPHLEGFVAVGWIAANTFWGAAALDKTKTSPAAVRRGAREMGRTRLAFLAASTLLVPALLFGQGPASGTGGVGWLAVAVGAVLLFSLVIARMSGFVFQVQRQARQLEDLALRDPLTGLPNRRVFEERLAAAVTAGSGRSPQVAVLDLNGFKDVNDRLGHTVGDRLLTAVAARLSALVREGDLVARLGGDEFAVLLADAHRTVMDEVAARLGTALRKPVEADGHELLVSASIGSADGTGLTDPGELLRRADLAMYAAKETGGARHRRYTRDLDKRAGEEAQLGAELRTALDTGQFQVVYQPIVSLPDARVVSVEALVRWHHPERGPVSPVEFIPVAEHNGLIVELGEWILRTACAQAVAWRREYGDDAPERMSVNVSARQLAEPGFAALVAETLAWTGLGAHQLTIEVTETAVFGGGQTVQTVQDLHELGIKIALDDFGTGHSSLGLLQTVPVDILKVDKSFVDTITMAGRHAVIATALIQVSTGLGLAAVAEGVETAEQAAELYRLGYRLAQGYHFGRPVPQPDFRAVARPAVGA